MSEKKIVQNSFYHGKVVVYQYLRGYRFSIDAPILADFLPTTDHPALEIGCGCGIISLLALHQGKFPSIRGLEIQEEQAGLARKNALENGMADRFEVFCGDFLKEHHRFKGTKVILTNPPYLSTGSGKLSPDPMVRRSKWDLSLPLSDLLKKTSEILDADGNFFLIYPHSRFDEFMEEARQVQLFPVRRRTVHSFKHGKAERFLIQLSTSRAEEEVLAPLVIFRSPGEYTAEMERIFSGTNRTVDDQKT